MMFYKLSKVFFILYLFYIGWFSDVFYNNTTLPKVFGVSIIVFFVLFKLLSKDASLTIPKPVILYIIFIFFSLLTGIFIAVDQNYLVSSLFTYSHKVILMIYIINVSIIEKDNKFFLKTWLVYSVIYMITMLFWGYENLGGRLLLSKTSNPNTDALTLLMGAFCCLALLRYNKLNQMLASFGIIGLFAYTILLTGSRKSFLALLILIFIWLLIALKNYWVSFSVRKKIFFSASIVIIGIGIYLNLLPMIKETVLYERLIERGFTILDDPVRSYMYREALELFAKSPLIGIGFDQYRLHSVFGTYSHSTYAELLASSGIIGTVIYLSSYMVIIINLIALYIKNKNNITSTKTTEYIILMLVLLILGTSIIHFYNIRDYVILSIIISYYCVEKRKLRYSVLSNN